MNEGHASLIALELLDEEARKAGRDSITQDDIEAVRENCVFTTHTPVSAGHDQFPIDLARRVIGSREDFFNVKHIFSFDDLLNMTYLALNLSRYVNGVAKKHGEVSRLMFTGYSIAAITNGVHAATWAAKPFQGLYDRHIPDLDGNSRHCYRPLSRALSFNEKARGLMQDLADNANHNDDG